MRWVCAKNNIIRSLYLHIIVFHLKSLRHCLAVWDQPKVIFASTELLLLLIIKLYQIWHIYTRLFIHHHLHHFGSILRHIFQAVYLPFNVPCLYSFIYMWCLQLKVCMMWCVCVYLLIFFSWHYFIN